jgi:hypothetical protein
MSPKLRKLGLPVAALALLSWPSLWVGAQEEVQAAEMEEAAGEAQDSFGDSLEGEGAPARQDFRDIDALLAQDEDALYNDEQSIYEPGGRRDPFRSLLRRSDPEEVASARPEGIAGLLIDDLRLEGVFVTPAGPAAQVQAASDQISYLLRPGDQLWDGDVVDVTVGEIVFKQSVDDPTALKPFREVTMRLYEP